MAEEGFPVALVTAKYWCNGLENDIRRWIVQNGETDVPLTIDGTNGHKARDIFRNPDMARVL